MAVREHELHEQEGPLKQLRAVSATNVGAIENLVFLGCFISCQKCFHCFIQCSTCFSCFACCQKFFSTLREVCGRSSSCGGGSEKFCPWSRDGTRPRDAVRPSESWLSVHMSTTIWTFCRFRCQAILSVFLSFHLTSELDGFLAGCAPLPVLC